MRFRFKSKKLEDLYTSEKGAHKYEPSVVEAFFDIMSTIDAMPDARDFYRLKSLHFEQLKGKRGKCGERSLRLNDQWRLIIAIEKDTEGKYVLIINIEDYH